jgi:quercetin dioxygenase-like cupin family protein
MKNNTGYFLVGVLLIFITCESSNTEKPYEFPPEPTVTYTETDVAEGQRIEHGELISGIDAEREALHAQHHPYSIIENRKIPGEFEPPSMTQVSDFVLKKEDLITINPGPGEYVHVMEGQRHGYRNLTIGITYTAPGGAPPMHTHVGEEAHVLTEGETILYALGDSIFTITGPYIVNIPPMVPHSFMNLSEELAELVVIFPTNVWEYDILNYFPFESEEAKALVEKAKEQMHTHGGASHSHD